tara:strand:- start:12 stop:179 length:168 start_codon:yes stop_codon:yes gene_type:complete
MAKQYQYVNRENELVCIKVEEGNKVFLVPIDTDNTDYAEILKQVADGDITIADAD